MTVDLKNLVKKNTNFKQKGYTPKQKIKAIEKIETYQKRHTSIYLHFNL